MFVPPYDLFYCTVDELSRKGSSGFLEESRNSLGYFLIDQMFICLYINHNRIFEQDQV